MFFSCQFRTVHVAVLAGAEAVVVAVAVAVAKLGTSREECQIPIT